MHKLDAADVIPLPPLRGFGAVHAQLIGNSAMRRRRNGRDCNETERNGADAA